MTLELDNTAIRKLIPNIIHEVEGETTLYEKLIPWLDSAAQWLTDNIVGEYEPTEAMAPVIEKIVVRKAFAEALPSLDLSITPAGLAVISTEGRVPASKERAERLIASLLSSVDAHAVVLQNMLLKDEVWRKSGRGQWFLSTFIPELNNAMPVKEGESLLRRYDRMRDTAMRFEDDLTERFLGPNLMDTLRCAFPLSDLPGHRSLYGMIRRAELLYISAHEQDGYPRCPDEHEVWHAARPILAQLAYWPELHEIWEEEMAASVTVEPFRSSRKGGMWL